MLSIRAKLSVPHLDKVFRHPRMVECSLWRVRLYPVVLVKQPVPRLLPHVDDKLLEAEALIVDDGGRGILQRLCFTLIPLGLGLLVISIDLKQTNENSNENS